MFFEKKSNQSLASVVGSTVKVGSGGTKSFTPGGATYIPPVRNVTLANALLGNATYQYQNNSFHFEKFFLPCNDGLFHKLLCLKHSRVSAENRLELMEMFREFFDRYFFYTKKENLIKQKQSFHLPFHRLMYHQQSTVYIQ